MTQTLRGRVIRNDNISVGNVCGVEMAVAVNVSAPALISEQINTNVVGPNVCPYGVEKIAVGVTGPNPEVP